MKKINNPFVLFFAALLLTAGCKKHKENNNNSNNNNATQQTCYLAKVIGDNRVSSELTYDNSNRLTMTKAAYDSGKIKNRIVIEYNSDGKVSRIAYHDSTNKTLFLFIPSYNSTGTLQEIVLTDSLSTFTQRTAYEYGGKRIDKSTVFANNIEESFSRYSYNANGDIDSVKEYSADSNSILLSTTAIEYDNMPPTIKCPAYDILQLSSYSRNNNHNITSYTYTNSKGQLDPDRSYTATYTYDVMSHKPLTGITPYGNGTVEHNQYTYNCK